MSARSPSRSQHSRQAAGNRELARAEADYLRFRQAYLGLASGEHNLVALAMVGADMERAHAVLQRLSGLQQLPFTHPPTRVLQREANRLAEEGV